MNIDHSKIPKEIIEIAETFKKSGFEIYLIGGCVRDLLLDIAPKDWDLTTNAKPEEIQELFSDSFYENNFGTVGIKTRSEDETLKVVEVTPYRKEFGYSDRRRPDKIEFSDNLEEDLKRRDFTINAIAYDPIIKDIKDFYKGQNDLENGLIRTVGNPDERFQEDALRIMRAIRFSAQLGFTIEQNTLNSIVKNKDLLKNISKERIGDEFSKIINTESPIIGLGMTERLQILPYISPNLQGMVGIAQNKQAHKYDVWEHCLRSLQHAADKNYSFEIRLAALFHDIGKPATKRTTNGKTTFYNHEMVGANVTRETLKDLRFSRETVKKVVLLVKNHMFFADTDQITLSAVRRLVAKVGTENIWDLINLRICDRIGTGRPKEEPYRLRKFQSMIDEVTRDPISVSMLKIDGDDLINTFHVKPGPKIRYILSALLEDVLENPKNNNEAFLVKRTEELLKLNDKELEELGEKSRQNIEDADQKKIKEIRNKRKVK
ncbi:CCA tRNA nucleotidyltransferase [Candidatus Parcubacteria bacterium]|nr:CCA tRNA nucleotidyltransferase [Candidatus Parcubacteria bacterium]